MSGGNQRENQGYLRRLADKHSSEMGQTTLILTPKKEGENGECFGEEASANKKVPNMRSEEETYCL